MPASDPKQTEIPAAVTEIARRGILKGMNLVRCACEFMEGLPPGQGMSIRMEMRGGSDVFKAQPRSIVCSFGATITVTGQDGKPNVGTISCDYAVVYEFADEAFFNAIRAEDRELFAAYNTSFQLWPHVREFVQSMAARMALAPIILPPFRPLELIGDPESWAKRVRASQLDATADS